MIQTVWRIFLTMVLLTAWGLTAVLIVSYFFGNIFGLISVSVHSQSWIILLLALLFPWPALKVTQRNLKQWYFTTGIGIYLAGRLEPPRAALAHILRGLYINLYLLADVVFCVGAPLLILTASVGWWLLDEVSYPSLLGYCCLISIIVFTGFYSNLVRLLSLGYFFGYWLLSEHMLLYPFMAPALVQENTLRIVQSGSLKSWLPVVGLALIAYLFVRRSKSAAAQRIESKAAIGGGRETPENIWQLISIRLNRDLLGNYLSIFCLLMAVPLGVILLNSMMGFLNPHILVFGFVIWILDRLWQRDVADEPALSRDLRYYANLIWKR